jgi:two-component sensor histidine kinase
MFATCDEALAMASRFFSTENTLGAFLVDEKGLWLAPVPAPYHKGIQNDLQSLRPRLAGWIRKGQKGDQQIFPAGGTTVLFILVSIENDKPLRALGIPMGSQGFEALMPATDTLLGYVDGIAFVSDGLEARSRGSLDGINGSAWEPESWAELWARLTILSDSPDTLYKQARLHGIKTHVYSLALCQFVEVSAGKAGVGIAGWYKNVPPVLNNAKGDEVARFFTYLNNPALQLPAAVTNPAGLGFAAYLQGDAHADWVTYLHGLSSNKPQEKASFSAEYGAGQSFYSLEIFSEPVYGVGQSLLGFHHVAYTQPDPILKDATNEKAIAASAYADAILLTKEANHRIKNSLSVAASLLQLQSYTVEDKVAKEALKDAVQRMYTVSDLHEALYKYTVGAEEVEAKPFLENIAERLRKLIGIQGVEIRTEIQDLVIPNKMASRIGFLVNELVLNAVKYAFTETKQGFIAIYLTLSGSTYYLSVQDNGHGMDERADVSESLGSTLITEFAKDLQAEMRLETQAGTRYVFTFSQ